MSTTAKRRYPKPGTPRPFSFRIPLSADEQRRAHRLADHERRSLSWILRDFIDERCRALGLDDDGPRRPARRTAI
jgi:hypothetical protein